VKAIIEVPKAIGASQKENLIMALSITIALATLASGALDDSTNAQRFTSAYEQYKAELETEEATIADAVSAQFSEFPGASQNMPALVHGVLNRLNVTPANHGTMEEKVLSYVRENSDRPAKIDRKTKEVLQAAEAPRTRLFGIKKGVGGGVCRWSDCPVKA
jgi:hypothetical protein